MQKNCELLSHRVSVKRHGRFKQLMLNFLRQVAL
jgi:hypothetical protein